MNVQQTLTDVGLDQHEIALYLALVGLREATAGQLSRLSHVPRTYAYRVLESLVEKGFVSSLATGSIRRYTLTDFEAPKRYLERQQLELYRAQQQLQALGSQLQHLSEPQLSSAIGVSLKDSEGYEDFWKLLHSTITREIWIVNPPEWWGNLNHSSEVKKWEQYREKQHIWEKRFVAGPQESHVPKFTELFPLKMTQRLSSTFLLIDQYQIQVTNWNPMRALRIESAEMVELQKSILA